MLGMERHSTLVENASSYFMQRVFQSPARVKFILLNIFVNCQLLTFCFLLYFYGKHYGLPHGTVLPKASLHKQAKHSNDRGSASGYSYTYYDYDDDETVKGDKRPSLSTYYDYYQSGENDKTALLGKPEKEVQAMNHKKNASSTPSKSKKGKGRLGAALTLLLVKKQNSKVDPPKEITVVMEKRLGAGGFCEVYRGEYQGRKYAFRIAKRKHKDSFSFIRNGYKYNYLFAKDGISPSVSGLFQVQGESVAGYMMKLMKGDLYLASKLPFKERIEIAYKLISQVEKLHALSYFHGDIKPGNILLDESYNPFISDVDSVSYFGDNVDPPRIAGGTRGYRDPQLALHRAALRAKNIRVTYPRSLLIQADVFSTTITVYYLLFKRSLFGHLINAINCGKDYRVPSKKTFTANVADNFGEFLVRFFEKFYLDPARNPHLYADSIVRLLDNGLFSSKSLQSLRENLRFVTANDVQRWLDNLNKVTPEKLSIECKLDHKAR